ncbi:MAG: glucose-6-phosphate dehydrogenase [Spirochaetia bacterium]
MNQIRENDQHTSESTSTSVVIFGATGDLTRRKLIPALYNNYRKGRLERVQHIVGCARREWSTEYFRERAYTGVKEFSSGTFCEETWNAFSRMLRYEQVHLDQTEDFRRLALTLEQIETPGSDRLYYLATMPELYTPVCRALGDQDMVSEDAGKRRIVIEKPFGRSGESARELDEVVHGVFNEHQVFRIDHYLGKEAAQNVMFLRFANTIFEPIWNRRYVENVQITVSEDVEVGGRGGYYDSSGVVRDMFQNHLLQLLALTAMEPPATLNPEAIRNERVKVLDSIPAVDPRNAVRAQYQGYRQTDRVAADSTTPTYAAMKLFVNSWRWQGVPFYLRSGKAMCSKCSEIVVRFQSPPGNLFNLSESQGYVPNSIAICIQPREGTHFKYQVKVPDGGTASRSVDMSFNYRDAFPDNPIPDSYERLLLDAISGDVALFARSDGIASSWRIIDPLLRSWETDAPDAQPLAFYKPGTWGPSEADELLSRSGHTWQLGCLRGDEDQRCIEVGE